MTLAGEEADRAFTYLRENGLVWANHNENNLTFHLWDTKQKPVINLGYDFVQPVCGHDSAIGPVGRGLDWLTKLVTSRQRRDYRQHQVCGLCARIADNRGMP